MTCGNLVASRDTRSPSAHLAVAAVLFVGCAHATPADLMERDRAFARDVAARRVDAWVEAFAPDGRELVDKGGVIEGRAAIRADMTETFANPDLTLTWAPTAARVSGTLGYTIGNFEVRMKGAVVKRGKYLTVWRLVDGKWLVAEDIGNSSP